METSDLLSRHLEIRIGRIRIDVDALLSGLAFQGHPMNELEQATQVYREALIKVQDRAKERIDLRPAYPSRYSAWRRLSTEDSGREGGTGPAIITPQPIPPPFDQSREGARGWLIFGLLRPPPAFNRFRLRGNVIRVAKAIERVAAEERPSLR